MLFRYFYLVPIRKSNWDSVVYLRASPWIPPTKTVRSSKFVVPFTIPMSLYMSLYTSPEAAISTVPVLLLHVCWVMMGNILASYWRLYPGSDNLGMRLSPPHLHLTKHHLFLLESVFYAVCIDWAYAYGMKPAWGILLNPIPHLSVWVCLQI